LSRELGHVVSISDRMFGQGDLAMHSGDYAAAHDWFTAALELQRSLSTPWMAASISRLGEVALRQDDYAQARAYVEESVALARESGLPLAWFQLPLVHLGKVALQQGDRAQARALFVEAQQRFKEGGFKGGVIYALEGLASLAVAQGQPERAVRLFAWADAMRVSNANTRSPADQADVDRDFAVIRTQLDEATIEAAWEAGRALPLEQAIAEALAISD
jgi:tetratricopeptide (TPR) repeat protein